MPKPTPEEKAPFGFEDTTQLVEWFRTQEISVAVAGLDAVHRNLVRAAVAAEREPLLDVIESCFSVGELRFGTNGLATTVRGKVMRVLIDAGRIDESGAAIRRGGEGEK